MRRAFIPLSVIGLCAVLASPAAAGLSNVIFRVEVSSSQGNGAWQALYDPSRWNGDTYRWALGRDIPIMSSTGELLATLRSRGTSLTAVEDPQVNLQFDVVAGPANTTFTISSALLSFPTIASPLGKASAGITATDLDGDGIVRTGSIPGGAAKSYLAQTNGFAGTGSGTTFAQLVDNSSNPTPFTTDTKSEEFGFATIPGSVSDMSSVFQFTLSANDSAAGTSVFVVQIPEPATGLLLIGAPATLLRRRR